MKKINFKKSDSIKILLFRTDKLGDVVLSLECIEALKTLYPKSHICFAMQSYTAPLIENNPFLDETILTDNCSQKELIRTIKNKNFDISISLFPSKIACYVPFFARIPIRIGPFSKIRSLLFTHKIRQKRSLGEKNEAQYNLDLLKPLGCEKKYFPKIYLSNEEISQAKNYLHNKFGNDAKKIIILHPGSGGSSKDWKIQNYFSLAEKIVQNNIAKVLITGSQTELNTYKRLMKNHPLLDQNNLLENQKSLRELLSIIAEAKLFLSNGTGPLHCAIALDVPTIGFHTLMRSCKPNRWGPFCANMKKHTIITPTTSSGERIPECISCNKKCPYYLCMDRILVEDIFEIIKNTNL
ncbi:glycosyltransferase family 9 protein [Helicobacter sp. 13S00477-4]|uniref:glycosyltransferase family 9 protein n=1 Tax=Helicobacter sp. 13S00477-4 TaxID=1905759 RepID=UPI000BA51E0B|nr:glycosyltransferase family 9 protein [Helicobacter sp. 13S00477-4]PAF51552.1 hypothetical protein BKH44_05785 [Helicobacter sp. 13S00477-4]